MSESGEMSDCYDDNENFDDEAEELEDEELEEVPPPPKRRKKHTYPDEDIEETPPVRKNIKIVPSKKISTKKEIADRINEKPQRSVIVVRRNIQSIGSHLKNIPDACVSPMMRKMDTDQLSLLKEGILQIVGQGIHMTKPEHDFMLQKKTLLRQILSLNNKMQDKKNPASDKTLRRILSSKKNLSFLRKVGSILARRT